MNGQHYKKQIGSENMQDGGSWLVTYADSMTLLMTFFIALFAMSSIDSVKYEQMVEAFNPDAAEKGRGFSEDYGTLKTLSETRSGLEKIAENIEGSTVTTTPEGVKFTLPNEILFRSASSELTQKFIDILHEILPEIRQSGSPIAVVGHTDNTPISDDLAWSSNYDLSGARATRVIEHLLDMGATPIVRSPTGNFPRFQVRGFGEYFPVTDNDSFANRAKNRRIEMVWLRNEPR